MSLSPTSSSGVCRMAEWLKKQTEREAEKEQRRLERLQRKLKEPKHQFTDPEYQRQCHDLSERLEDSVMKGEGGSEQLGSSKGLSALEEFICPLCRDASVTLDLISGLCALLCVSGLQASCSQKTDDVSPAKRPNCDPSEQPQKKKQKKKNAAEACLW